MSYKVSIVSQDEPSPKKVFYRGLFCRSLVNCYDDVVTGTYWLTETEVRSEAKRDGALHLLVAIIKFEEE